MANSFIYDYIAFPVTLRSLAELYSQQHFFSNKLNSTFIYREVRGRWSGWMAGIQDAGLWHQRPGFAS